VSLTVGNRVDTEAVSDCNHTQRGDGDQYNEKNAFRTRTLFFEPNVRLERVR